MRDPAKAIAALTEGQRELLRLRLKNRGQQASGAAPAAGIPRLPRDQGSFPLSPAQQRLWFLYQWDPESPLYNVPACFRLEGELNREAFLGALSDLVVRHESLRLEFRSLQGRPGQSPVSADRFRAGWQDLSALPEAEASTRLITLAREEIARPFSFPDDLPFRATLVRVSPRSHGVLLIMHHLVSDGASVALLLSDLRALYLARCAHHAPQLAPLLVQYVDYAAWQAGLETSGGMQAGIGYWKQSLAGAPPEIELPVDHGHSPAARGGEECGTTFFSLSPEVMEALKRAMLEEGATAFMGMLALYAAYLVRKCGQEEVVIGVAISGRSRVELETMAGVFVNTLALRVDTRGNPGYRELVRRVKTVVLAAFAHQEVPFEKVVEAVSPDRQSSRSPLFQVAFGFQNATEAPSDWAGLTLQGIPGVRDSANFELELRIHE